MKTNEIFVIKTNCSKISYNIDKKNPHCKIKLKLQIENEWWEKKEDEAEVN